MGKLKACISHGMHLYTKKSHLIKNEQTPEDLNHFQHFKS